MSDKTKLLREIQQLDFAMIELGLYLNNQPQCEEALVRFDEVQRMYVGAKEEFENRFGPLTFHGVNTRKDGWSWIHDPWPWEGED